jgi:hypothetical protein
MVAALVSAPSASAEASVGALPQRGVLVPGTSLGGVRLGDASATVTKRWGRAYVVCAVCSSPTWLYTFEGRAGTGAAVSFRRGRVIAVFTLGVPRGWRTTRGVELGDPTEKLVETYAALRWKTCIGYGALSMRKGAVVTSIYTFGEYVYGFALTRPWEPVCQ